MKSYRKLSAAIAPLFCFGFAGIVSAAPIPTLFNTGVATNDANGNPTSLVADGSNDPHWNLISTPSGPVSQSAVVILETAYPFSVYQADGPNSKWDSLRADESSTYEAVGTYTYTTTFSMSGLNPSGASITGTYLDDDELVDIKLNNFDTGISHQATNVTGGQPFTISSGFVAGTNTLTFIVMNDNIPATVNPTALRVELSGTAVTLPEPYSISLATAGAVMALRRRARRRS